MSLELRARKHRALIATEHAAGVRSWVPEGYRKLMDTKVCERCRMLRPAIVRGVEGRATALCNGCDWELRGGRAHPSVERARREIAALEQDVRSERTRRT
jgi:hypothetical protein